jgi:hypothetical protein
MKLVKHFNEEKPFQTKGLFFDLFLQSVYFLPLKIVISQTKI